MGIYLNPGNENFRRMLATGIYVDKTMMIRELNRVMETENNYVCISRPRRFGKTIANNMLAAYYSKGCDSSGLFAPLKIASAGGYREKLNKYNVLQIDMNSEFQNTSDTPLLLKRLTRKIKKELGRAFPSVELEEEDTLAESLLCVYAATGETFVIIIDEYDVLVRERAEEGLFDEYLSFLNGLFKSNTVRPAISLAYLTGILPIVRDKIQSKLNNFDEYTMLGAAQLAEYVGFTAEEVEGLCGRYGIDYGECRRWYDGYRQDGLEIYNPESVVMMIRKGRFANYWSLTSSYEAIADRIRQDFEGTRQDVVRMIAGESVDVDAGMFLNTLDEFMGRDEVFTCLMHLGYLAYDEQNQTCRIPNWEVRMEWQRAISSIEEYSVTNRIIRSSKELLSETLRGNGEAVAAALDESHIHVCSNRSYNNEDALQSAIYLAYIYALNQYTIVREMTTGKGFADVVFLPFAPNLPAMIIELKRNGSVESALQQIREKRYFDSLGHYAGKLLFVGINYDEKEKTHSCKIEEFRK